jgi:hypothetical protein
MKRRFILRRLYRAKEYLLTVFHLRYVAIVLRYKFAVAGGKAWTYGTP